MATEIQRSRGRPQNYKMDRGGVAAEFGPFYGTVKNTVDPDRAGRIQVYIEAFSGGNENDDSKWITVSYMPQFFGATPYNPPKQGLGSYIDGNANSYGMWFTPPDVGLTVICVFVNGDRTQGYYIGVSPDQSLGHMVPAIGASKNFVTGNENQAAYFNGATQLPVVEINTNNLALEEAGRFFDKDKPVQSVVAQTMFQQGLIKDTERGPIASSSQRESPSAVYGISTPGAPIYQGGMKFKEVKERIDAGSLKPQDAKIIGRVGGHSIVMDDGDINGDNRLIRFRTTSGHQITMSDTGNFFYITHANGFSWFELGAEGTVDVYATNSINLRTQGDINLHADQDINMFAGRNFSVKAMENVHLEATEDFTATAQGQLNLYSKSYIGVKADGSLALDSAGGGWLGGDSLAFTASGIDFNGPSAASVTAPNPITTTVLPETSFSTSSGWEIDPLGLESIVTRAPTHEPYPYHNTGVDAPVVFEENPTPPPAAAPVPAEVEISRTA